MGVELTARQQLEKRGAFFYSLTYAVLFFFSVTTQILTGLGAKEIIPGVVVNSFNIGLSFYILYRKSNGLKAVIIPWLLGFTSLCAPLAVKYNYVFNDGWTFAAQSNNTTTVMVAFAAMLYLFYQPKLFKFYSVFAISNWILFMYLAYTHGGEFHWNSHINGVPVISGIIVLREFYVIIVMVAILFITYRNIPDIIKYENRVLEQTDHIKKQADAQRSIRILVDY